MDHEPQISSGELVLVRRVTSADQALSLTRQGPARLSPSVSVRRHGERRHDFFRRWFFRGVDELRRQQANVPTPKIGTNLDDLL